MISQRKNIPLVRVKGFEESWELCTLGEHIEDYVEKTTVQNQYPVLTSSQNKGIVRQEDYFANRQVTTDSNIGYFVLPKGFFTYRSRSDNGVFKFNRNDLLDKGIISYFYPVFSIVEGDSDFYLKLLNTSITKQAMLQAEGTGQKVLSLRKFKSIKTLVPSLPEQSAIGSLFRIVDDLLSSYKVNLANYQSLKAAMLSKMFPKAGQTVPEIRLDEFEGEWECLKMADIFKIIDGDRGKNYPGESDFLNVGHTLFLDTGNVKKTGLDFSSIKFISEEKDKELRNGKLILGDFILTSRGTLGNVAYYDENIQRDYSSVRINSAMLILRPLLGDKISHEYILAILRGNLISDFMKVNQVGSAQPHITKKEFSKIKVQVPSNIREQQSIGSYFSNLDQLITSYREKITQLETLKKKLLQDMFL